MSGRALQAQLGSPASTALLNLITVNAGLILMTSVHSKGVILECLGSDCSNSGVLGVTRHLVHIFEMSAQVATLRKSLTALRTVVGSLTCVLAEVISEIAALLKDLLAATMHTSEVLFDALRQIMFDLNGLMPLLGNAFERP